MSTFFVTTKKYGSQCVRADQKPLSYTREREIILNLFKKSGFNEKRIWGTFMESMGS